MLLRQARLFGSLFFFWAMAYYWNVSNTLDSNIINEFHYDKKIQKLVLASWDLANNDTDHWKKNQSNHNNTWHNTTIHGNLIHDHEIDNHISIQKKKWKRKKISSTTSWLPSPGLPCHRRQISMEGCFASHPPDPNKGGEDLNREGEEFRGSGGKRPAEGGQQRRQLQKMRTTSSGEDDGGVKCVKGGRRLHVGHRQEHGGVGRSGRRQQVVGRM